MQCRANLTLVILRQLILVLSTNDLFRLNQVMQDEGIAPLLQNPEIDFLASFQTLPRFSRNPPFKPLSEEEAQKMKPNLDSELEIFLFKNRGLLIVIQSFVRRLKKMV